MNFFTFLLYFTFVQSLRAEVYTNENGVTFEYALNFKSRCRAQDGRFASIQGLSVAQCVEECGLRQHCEALNYRRRAKVCELFSIAEEGDNRTGDCTFIPASSINVLQSPCGMCNEGQVCDTNSQTCIFKECQPASAPENGKILGNKNEIGANIKYQCNDIQPDDVMNAVCLSNGQWSATFNCSIDCGIPPSISNGNIVQDNMDSATVTCETGYQTNRSTINCTASGNWENATCSPISCGNPAQIANGNLFLSGGTMYQNTATVTCDPGYQGSLNTTICTASGNWDTVTCDPISCGNPASIANGNIVLNSGTIYQDTASATCNAGFEGSVNIISCTASGSWEAVTCDPISCGSPASIANGNIVLNSGTIYQDTASATCNAGYEGSVNIISCTASGSWEAVTCDPISCGSPASIANGNIVLNSGTIYQDTASATCNAGYEGSVNTISCTASGSWEAVTCDPISCGNPASIANGNIVLNSGTIYQDTASPTCNVGYEGSVNIISCTASGSWEAVTCDPISCGNPASIANGNIVLNSGTAYQDTASVTCDVGFERSAITIKCTDSGSWEPVTCDPISISEHTQLPACGTPPSIDNGNIALNSGTMYLDTASVTCNTNFQASSSTISCTSSGSWETATCNAVDCYVNNVWDYAGSKNITPTGYACERWVDHSDDYRVNVEWIPESTLEGAHNYCRNPTGNNWQLWCFSSDPSEDYELCGISQC